MLYQIRSDDQSVVVVHITIPPPRPSPTLTYPCAPVTQSSPNSLKRGLLIVFHCLLQTNLPFSLYFSPLTTSLLMLSSSNITIVTPEESWHSYVVFRTSCLVVTIINFNSFCKNYSRVLGVLITIRLTCLYTFQEIEHRESKAFRASLKLN